MEEITTKKKKLRLPIISGFLVLVLLGVLLVPFISSQMKQMEIPQGKAIELQSPQEFYQMFQCQCCGKPIDTNCCGMAKQGKEHLDQLLLSATSEEEVMVNMVKKFGYNVLMNKEDAQVVKDYLQENTMENPPKIEIEDPKYDFGTILQSKEIRSTSFTIKNTGKSDLIIENMDTSCMCTTAKLVYDGKESPEFGMSMHGTNPKGYSLSILPGESAELIVMYDPMAHGPQKKISQRIVRMVTITSNDPVNFQKQVRIELTQVTEKAKGA
jgi:hypothetical protein